MRKLRRQRLGVDAGRQGGFNLSKVKAGAGAGDEVAGEEQIGGTVPIADGKKGIRADNAEEGIVWGELTAEVREGVDCVIGLAVGAGSIEEGDFCRRFTRKGQAGHRDAVSESGREGLLFEGLRSYRGDEHTVELETLARETGERDVAAMGRVEGSAEEGYAHSDFIVSLGDTSRRICSKERMGYRAYIGLGSNLASSVGSPVETVRAGVQAMAGLGNVIAQSSFYRTAPVGFHEQPYFINAVVRLETGLEPEELLGELLAIERSFGRERRASIPKGPRTLDLDLLLVVDDEGKAVVHESPSLTLPHPEMASRRFVLEPLAEIAPELRDPVWQKTMRQLLDELAGGGEEVTRL